jgi:hypothetical protein
MYSRKVDMHCALLVLTLVGGIGCSEAVSPTTDLTGMWSAGGFETEVVLTLMQDGMHVTGSGSFTRFINPPKGSFTIAGTYAPPQVTLTFSYDDGVTTHYVGTVRGADSIIGAETFPGGEVDSLALTRLARPR